MRARGLLYDDLSVTCGEFCVRAIASGHRAESIRPDSHI